jgi:thiol-disulfide isomerase/thioredoxin
MKKIYSFAFFVTFCFTINAQTPYTVIKDGDSKILNGIISKYILINDTSFNWYAPSVNDADKNSPLIQSLSNAPEDITFLIFGGTWCGDTRNILPKFFTYQQSAGFPDSKITFVGVDRKKTSLGNLAAVMGITNVPTIIVLKKGVEIGRVVEYGTSGLWDKEVSELIR